uniref:Uncharacterized protein n=1 Tax=Octopus bimaculoides TaxID=37653 RepID=A0A0L8GKD4_OCTBM
MIKYNKRCLLFHAQRNGMEMSQYSDVNTSAGERRRQNGNKTNEMKEYFFLIWSKFKIRVRYFFLTIFYFLFKAFTWDLM